MYALVASRGSGGGHNITYDLSSRSSGGTAVAVVGHSAEEIKELLNTVDDHGRRELERTGIIRSRGSPSWWKKWTPSCLRSSSPDVGTLPRHATVAGNTFVPVSQGFQPSTFSSGPSEATPVAGLTQVAKSGQWGSPITAGLSHERASTAADVQGSLSIPAGIPTQTSASTTPRLTSETGLGTSSRGGPEARHQADSGVLSARGRGGSSAASRNIEAFGRPVH